MQFLSRQALATRWDTSARTVDRRRAMGLLPWIDLACGRGARPVVRFKLADVEAFEGACRVGSAKDAGGNLDD